MRAALANIHRDRQWWRKILIGGALMLTIFGYPWAAGLVIESLDYTRKGFPTPLPPWRDWSLRYINGLFAALIDFVFFFLPILVAGLFIFCAGVVFLTASGPASWLAPIAIVLALFELAMFALGVAPVGRLIYVESGRVEDALSRRPLREALRPGAWAIYARARLSSLPAYLPLLALLFAIWAIARSAFPGVWAATLLLIWLACSALLYAHLVVAQLYAAAEREAGYVSI